MAQSNQTLKQQLEKIQSLICRRLQPKTKEDHRTKQHTKETTSKIRRKPKNHENITNNARKGLKKKIQDTSACALLVENTIPALPALDHIARLQRVLSPAI